MLYFILLLFLVLVFPIMIFTPYITRKTESFGVTIPEKLFYRDDFREMRKKYATQTFFLSILLIVIYTASYFFVKGDENLVSIIFTVILMAYIIISFFIYLKFHRLMRLKKDKEKWLDEQLQTTVIHTKFREQRLTISHWWYVIPFILTIGLIAIMFIFYDKIPNEIPMNYNLSGEVTSWKEKSYATVLMMPILQLFFVFMFLFINVIIARSKQQISPNNPEKSLQQNIIFRRRWSIFLYLSLYGLIFLFTFMQLGTYFFTMNKILFMAVPLIVSLVTILGVMILAITTGQGGSRVKISSADGKEAVNRDDDKYWKLGQFYFNKNDPAIFVEKRFGVGWTMNFGRPLGWIIFLGMIGLPIVIMVVLSNL